MKKFVIMLGIGLMTSPCFAACFGAFCWDDTGAAIGGVVMNGNGNGHPSLTKAQMNAATPSAKGQTIFCSDCTRSPLCISSATVVGSYEVAVETGTMAAPTHCQ